jgi:3-phosphoshikimate 1-carboxyvinyltransferase
VALTSSPSGPLRGSFRLPGDKSITHRAILFGAWAEGETTVHAANAGADCAALARAVGALGAVVRAGLTDSKEQCSYRVRGTAGQWDEPTAPLDLGNSGTAFRLLAGSVATANVFSILDGDRSLRRRPMARIVEPLRRMGARVDGAGGGTRAPLAIRGGGLSPIRHVSAVASAQVKSAVLLAGLGTRGETWVEEPRPSRDHTERLLPLFGGRVLVDGEGRVGVSGPQTLRGADIEVPGDFSAAAFWLVAALIVPGSEIELIDVGLNPRRTGLLRVLARMGAEIEATVEREAAGEPVGRLRARASALHATAIGADEVPDLLDEIPIWCVAAALAAGASSLLGAAELRGKESDRLRGLARGLARLGVTVTERPDGLTIEGLGGPAAARENAPLRGGKLSSAGDHRLAMSFLVAGLRARDGVQVSSGSMVDTSYPGFYSRLLALVSSR